jgi:hypothetical protein
MRSRPAGITLELASARDRRLLSDVSRPVERVFRSVELLSERMLAIAAAASIDGRTLERRDLLSLRAAVAALLNRHAGFVAGAGVVTARDVLADASLWIEWWWLARDGAVERLEVDLDPESAEFYDYTTTEWFRDPRQTGARHIAGPYVDYICTREYTFTVSIPLVHAGRFIGVAGADILASRVEQLVGRSLAELPCVAALASGSGRIISSNTAALMPGSILGRARPGPALRAVAGPSDRGTGGSLPWVLLTGEARGGSRD